MSIAVPDRHVSLGGVRAVLGRLGVVWPVLASALVLLAFAGTAISSDHGNPAALVQFGSRFVQYTHPPAGDPIVPGTGYDGQIYWLQATDPLIRHVSTAVGLNHVSASYHLQRFAYPALAWLLAAGQTALLPWSLLAINVLATLGLTAAFAVYARRRGFNPAWAFVIGLAPGLVIGVWRDLSDVLATTAMVAGLLAWDRGRARTAGALLAVAALSREPMTLAAAAVGLDLVVRCWRQRDSWRDAFATLRWGWPAVALPVVGYLGWEMYLRARALPAAHGSAQPTFPPFKDFYEAAHWTIAEGSSAHDLFVLPFLGLTLAAIALSVWMIRRQRNVFVLMAILYGLLVLPLAFLNDGLALTRYTAPLFVCVMIAGLKQRSRPALAISAAATAMTLLLPLLAY